MDRHHYETVPGERQDSIDPQKQGGFFSTLTFRWMNGVFKIGAKRPLEESDFLPLQGDDDTKWLTERIQRKWIFESERCAESGKELCFWKTVFASIPNRQCAFLFFTGLLDAVCRVLQPLFLGFLLLKMTSTQDGENSYLYIFAGAMFLNALVRIFASHSFIYHAERLGMQLRAGIKGLVYLKVLHLGQKSVKDFTVGKVMDLISNDVQRMELAPKYFFSILQSLFYLFIGTCLAGYCVGFHAVFGLATVTLLVPLLVCAAKLGGKLRKKTARVTDKRLLVMNEIVSAIRAVKTNAWEWIYRDKIRDIRREEIRIIRQKFTVLSVVVGPLFGFSDVASFIAVVLMMITGVPLTPVKVFMLLAFTKTLILSFAYRAGIGLQLLSEAKVSLQRVQAFLSLPNLPQFSKTSNDEQEYFKQQSVVSDVPLTSASSVEIRYAGGIQRHKIGTDKEDATSAGLSIINAESQKACIVANLTIGTDTNSERYILHDISFEMSRKSLVVLTGPVGSGKSSILAAINKEVVVSAGSVVCLATIAHVSQIPWIFSGTILENILFGKDYNEERFKAVIDACALSRDLEVFPDGHKTIVGERGAVLSGGQQSRVSLARAVYADADVYLMDDPLSAVDTNVREHIFEKCVCGLLSSKARLLVTYQVSHMKMADQIILLSEGEVLTKGSYAEMTKTGLLDTALKDVKNSSHDRKRPDKPTKLLEMDVKAGLEIPEEDRSVGRLSLKHYWQYFRAGQSTISIVGLVLACLFTQAMVVAPDIWLSNLVEKPTHDQRTTANMLIYLAMVCGILLCTFMRAALFYRASLKSSEQLHDQMVVATLKAPVLFFDANPIGRILNRYSKDIGCMDEIMPTSFLASVNLILYAAACILVPMALNPWVALASALAFLGFFSIARYYLNSSRELWRLESISRSPIFSHVSETMSGLDTIRSRGRHKDFVLEFYRLQNKQNQVANMCLASVRWMGIRVDVFSALLVGVVAFLAVLTAQDPVRAGLSLVYVTETINVVQFAIQQASVVENNMTSIERVMTYTKIEPEPGYDVDTKPPSDWPRDPSVILSNVSLTYYPGGPQVLKDLNITIKGQMKVGVAGRTGCGKSSIICALLRMPEANGVITIDGIDLARLNIQDSRRHLAVLSQKPVLLSGSLRKTLDPLTQHKDSDLWRVLEYVQLKCLVESLEGGLDYEVREGGGNFSVGERQLLCLARVLLQRNKVLILDEPTANVDPTTERKIQNTVRDQLKECTVITVAHRLNTIRDCDKILVMEEGKAVEFGSYEELISKEDGVFAEIIKKQL